MINDNGVEVRSVAVEMGEAQMIKYLFDKGVPINGLTSQGVNVI